MWWKVAVTLIAILAVSGLICGLGYYGYSHVEATVSRPPSVVQQWEAEPGSVLSTLEHFTVDDWVQAIALAIQGVKVDATLTLRNTTFVPLFIPSVDHQLFLEGHRFGTPAHTPSMWLLWWHERPIPVSTTLTMADLPPAALAVPHSVLAGGDVDLTVESKVNLGVFSFTRTWRMTVNLPRLPVSAVPVVSPPHPPSICRGQPGAVYWTCHIEGERPSPGGLRGLQIR